MQVITVFYQECGKYIHAVVDIDFCQDDTDIRNSRKICRNLERLHLTPRLLHYELINGFPSFSPFDPKDYGGYSFCEMLDKIELSDFQEIARYCIGDGFDDFCCQFDLMNEEIRKLFKGIIHIFAEEAKASGKEIGVEG